MELKVNRLEELAMNAFPAISTELYDGWIFRYSNGYTYRGNSINPLYNSSYDFDKKIKYCERKCAESKIPCVFKMNEYTEEGLDLLLESKDYIIKKKVNIMQVDLKNFEYIDFNEVGAKSYMTEEWLNDFIVLNGTEKEEEKIAAKTMLNNINEQVICASIFNSGKMAACGLGVMEDGKVGLYDIRVSNEYRRQGLGTKICQKIISEAIKKGTDTAYLQVAATNDIAIRMYEKIGFRNLYTYWYRVKEIFD